jgi:acetyltransferase (GNAT) family protein
MIYLKGLWIKFRYSRFLRLFFDALARLGIRVSPYYLFREIISPANPPDPSGFENYDVGFWGLKEMKQMALIPGRKFSEEFLVQRLSDGHKCLGLKKDNNLIAFTWCNFKEATFKYHHFLLKPEEAYLFDAYTLMTYRGKGIAPFLRYHLYKELKNLGHTRLYSYSDYFNKPAVRFKNKLNAKKEKLFLTIELFGKWRFHFVLKDYQK